MTINSSDKPSNHTSPPTCPSDTNPTEDEISSILSEDGSMSIAIVGMGFRGPGDATNVEKLWKMILEGREGWSHIPEKKWNPGAFYHPDNTRHGTINVEGGHFLTEDVSLFDAPFFSLTGDEAAAMDPQQRLLLEVTYEGIENAGIPLPNFMGTKTSCFVGSFSADYTDMLLRDPEAVPMYQCTNAGQSRAMTANRISYFFDLKGPSVTVDTACSGSLVALHLACQSLRTGDASMAIAAGVNVVLCHEFMSTMSMMKFLSPDGRCYTFDENANGYARGEAIGCLILKPLKDAIRDGDTIRAVIRGSGSNQDGRTPGITLPSGTSQEALIRDVYRTARLDPSETEFVEAHGTGTQAGDPIETGALSRVFGPGRSNQTPLRIGSIKTNVGHLEGASGVAGVIKAVLMLENRTFLPNRNFQKLNPKILLDEWKQKVQLDPETWDSVGPHRVSVNSFGYGGSNAHVVLEDGAGYLSDRGLTGKYRKTGLPIVLPQSPIGNENGIVNGNGNISDNEYVNGKGATNSHRSRLFTISGFDESSCIKQIQLLREYLQQKVPANEEFLSSFSYTLNERRTKLGWKAAFVGDAGEGLIESLSRTPKLKRATKKPNVSFVFTGQGAQWCGMGKELFDSYPVFRQSCLRINAHMSQIGAPYSLVDEILKNQSSSRLSHPLHSQPICSALQIALVDLLASWDIHPESVTGHSSGEIAAAYAAGVLSMEDAMSVAYYRGVSASKLPVDGEIKGAMLALGMSAEEVQPYVDSLQSGKAVVACINSPSTITISGDLPAVEELEHALSDKQVFSRRLAVDVAYHSHHMERIGDEYLASIAHIKPRLQREANTVMLFSSVTGKEIEYSELGPPYWVRNLLGQVKFVDALRSLCFETNQKANPMSSTSKRSKRAGATKKVSIDCLVEIGPHSALSGSIKQILKADNKLDAADITYTSALTRKTNAVTTVLNMAAVLTTAGYPLNFSAINNPDNEHPTELLVDLPPYAWNHSRSYWAEPRLSKVFRNRKYPRTDILGVSDTMGCSFEPRWRNILRLSEIPWLEDHKIQSNIVYPAAGYIAMAIEAASQHATANSEKPIFGYRLRHVRIQSALVIQETSAVEVMISLNPLEKSDVTASERTYRFHVYSVTPDNRWTENCKGIVEAQFDSSCMDDILEEHRLFDVATAKNETNLEALDIKQFYEMLSKVGLEYGPCFANMAEAHFNKDLCIAEIIIPDTASVMPMNFQYPSLIHPCTLDSFFHTIFASLSANMDLTDGPAIPVSIDEMYLSRKINSMPGQKLNIQTRISKGSAGDILASIHAVDGPSQSEAVTMSITGLRCRRLENEMTSTSKQVNKLAYGIKWEADSQLLSSHDIVSLLRKALDTETSNNNDLEMVALHYVKKAVDSIVELDAEVIHPSIKGLWSYLVQVAQNHNFDQRLDLDSIKSSGQVGQLLCLVGESLEDLLRNKIHISTILSDATLNTYWDNAPSLARGLKAASEYLSMLGHKNPNLSILEIESGPASSSSMFLEKLTGNTDHPRCAQYILTDKDPSVFEHAAERLRNWEEWTQFKKLDIEADLEPQGFAGQHYDIIIVPHGMYKTKSRAQGLKNIHSLLKGDGHLVIVDPVNRDRLTDRIIFGSIHGWWTDDPNPWDHVLQQSGFLDNVIVEDGDGCSVLVSRSARDTPEPTGEVLIIAEEGQSELSASLESFLAKTGLSVEIKNLTNASPAGRVCIVLSDLKAPVLAHPSDESLEKLKQIFLQSKSVLWTTRGGAISPTNPDAGMAVGFARTARSESGVEPIVTLDLDGQSPLSNEKSAEVICKVVQHRLLVKNLSGSDTEYAERDGVVLIPRVVENSTLNKAISSSRNSIILRDQIFKQTVRPIRATIDPTSHVYFVDDDRPVELAKGCVGIQVQAIGVTKHDAAVALGEVSATENLIGSQCSGTVYAVGEGVDDFSPGDRVVCLGSGTAANIYHDRASVFQKLPDNVRFELGAIIPVPYCAAFYIAHNLARISRDDTVLIRGAGPYQQALAEICITTGVRVLAVVADEKQKGHVSCSCGIPKGHIFIDTDRQLAKNILQLTNKRRVDVIINTGATEGKAIQSLWKCIAPYGRFIQLEGQNGKSMRISLPKLTKDIQFATFDFFRLWNDRPDAVCGALKQVMDLFRAGSLYGHCTIDAYNISQLNKALEAIPETSLEAVVATATSNDTVKAIIPQISDKLFRPDASYLLVGGMGGIGRATAVWMANNGAKTLIFTSRSGLSRAGSQETVQALEEKGVRVVVQTCDIAVGSDVESMMAHLSESLPPIRGVIQAAMVLKDIHIETMTADHYNPVLQPKYAGTWNLHNHLPRDLDFFVMLSSISGVIGNATQSAYAAGSTFMDAFAAYRNSLGLPGVALDLGVITDVGYVAENKELAEKMAQLGFQGTDTQTLMSLIEAAIAQSVSSEGTSQIITGLGEWKEGQSLGNFDAPLFAQFRRQFLRADSQGNVGAADTLRDDLRVAKTIDDASELIYTALSAKIAAHLSVPVDSISPSSPISEYGVDSVVAVELRNWITKKMESTVPILEILASGSLLELAGKIAGKSQLVKVEE